MSRIRHLLTSSRISRLFIGLLFLFPIILFVPGFSGFPYPPSDTRFSDLTLTHYPNAVYLRDTLVGEHRLPFWSPNILSGSPFAANPLSGIWYPPGWFPLLFPLPFGFNLMILAHLVWGGLGMYYLLRAEGLSRWAALFGGLSFELMPKVFAHYGAGHLTLLYALPWTPWLLWASRGRVLILGRRLIMAEACILALLIFADVRWGFYAGLIWLLYSLLRKFEKEKLEARIIHITKQILLALLLIAPLALPFAEFVRLSSRMYLKPEEILVYSLPISRVLGLIFPDFGGFHEYMLYVGEVILLFSALGIFWKATRRKASFWVWIAIFSLVATLGSHVPLFNYLVRIPGFSLLRVPSRALFVTCLSLSVLAAHALDYLLTSISQQLPDGYPGLSLSERKKTGLVLTGLVGFSLALSAGVWTISKELPKNFSWGAIFILFGAIWIGLKLSGRIPDRIWFVVILGLCLLDLGVVDRSLFIYRTPESVFAEGQRLAQHLASELGEFRVYSPSYSLPQHTAANYHLQLADGIDPMQLQSYVEFMQGASGVPRTHYSVTLPPFSSGNPSHDNAAFQPDPVHLGWLNVRYIVSEFDLREDRLNLLAQYGESRLYENLEWIPRAWVQTSGPALRESSRNVNSIRWNPDRIELTASGPGLLVLSEIIYPGWRVLVDSKEAQVEPVVGLLRGVRLEQGSHEVIFFFRPVSVYAGIMTGIFALLLVVLSLFRQGDSG